MSSQPNNGYLFIMYTISSLIITRDWREAAYSFGRVCLSVCLSDDNFRKRGRRKFIFAHVVYL